jgi:hypothetical protein
LQIKRLRKHNGHYKLPDLDDILMPTNNDLVHVVEAPPGNSIPLEHSDAQRKALDSFNDHQKDNRSRATQLVNYAFLLAGGSFTASVTVFSSRSKEQLTPVLVQFLHDGWYNLFLSMVAFFTLVTVMIVRDYFIAEINWRPRLHKKKPFLEGKPLTYAYVGFELLLFGSGIFGFGTLSYGLYKIMEAACALVA